MRIVILLLFVSSSLFSMELDSVPSVASAPVGVGVRAFPPDDSPHSSLGIFLDQLLIILIKARGIFRIRGY